jgi:antitoxin MazE
MTTRIARWGNSLGIRIPKSVAHNAQIEEGDSVELTVRNGTIVVRPARPRYSLELVGRITPRTASRNGLGRADRPRDVAKAHGALKPDTTR